MIRANVTWMIWSSRKKRTKKTCNSHINFLFDIGKYQAFHIHFIWFYCVDHYFLTEYKHIHVNQSLQHSLHIIMVFDYNILKYFFFCWISKFPSYFEREDFFISRFYFILIILCSIYITTNMLILIITIYYG